MIESAKYTETGSILVVIDGEELSVPGDDFGNRHRIMLANWEAEEGNEIQPYVPPEPESVVTILPAVTLWERTTSSEAAQIEDVMATQDPRSRNIFRTAQTFRSDHELWPILKTLATQLFGAERAEQLLAP